jgi:hypothetical protein
MIIFVCIFKEYPISKVLIPVSLIVAIYNLGRGYTHAKNVRQDIRNNIL